MGFRRALLGRGVFAHVNPFRSRPGVTSVIWESLVSMRRCSRGRTSQTTVLLNSALLYVIANVLFTAEPLYFGQPFINLNLPSNAVAGDHVFDLKSLLILDREHFVAFQLRCLPGFLGAYFGYFHYRWFFLFIIR